MTAPDEFATALDLYKTMNSHPNTLWNLFSVVSLAVVGYVAGAKPALGGRGKLWLGFGYFVFGISNHLAIRRAQEVFVHAVELIQSAGANGSSAYRELLNHVEATPVWGVELFHAVMFGGVLLAIYAAHHHDRLSPRGQRPN